LPDFAAQGFGARFSGPVLPRTKNTPEFRSFGNSVKKDW
jgi:hypothetical protein